MLLGILSKGVPPGSPNPDPISDQKMSFSTPVFRPGSGCSNAIQRINYVLTFNTIQRINIRERMSGLQRFVYNKGHQKSRERTREI